ncbi:MAG: S9 family peptidase, partial [Bacteroidota bacterium]|nr:S9 family peptidase [Bacteroidota bacterium]
ICIAEGSDGIVYGESVSRNEFGIDGGLFPSPDGKKLAFYRKDESRVTKFPLLDITTRTGSLKEIRYPMNGMESELITLGVYDTETGRTLYLDVTDFSEERYLTNVTWTPDSKQIWIQVMARSQHEMHLNSYSAETGAFIRTLLTEENEAWVEPMDPVWFPGERYDLFFYRTDNRDGYRALYLVDTLGTAPRRLTPAPADAAYVANTEKALWYTSAEVSPIENHLFRMDLKLAKAGKNALRNTRIGKPVRLTTERGWHTVAMNEDRTWYFDSWSNLNLPGKTVLRSTDGKKSIDIAESANPIADFAQTTVELGTVKSADGQFDNYYRLIYPLNFDPQKKYPLIVYVYGGPHSQLVKDTWLGEIRLWEMLMAQKGHVVYIQANRDTENRGAAFEKAINRRCGVAEMADQVAGIRKLCEQPWIDSDRIGVHGWSYGGFMTISLMTHYPEIFKVGVAGGPVIDWKWYEVMYGERYMDNPDTNPQGFAETSLINAAPRLKGRLLICQGAVDNTCVWQHSLSFVQACIEKLIPIDYLPYPLAEHNVRGPLRAHLMDSVTRYFEEHL